MEGFGCRAWDCPAPASRSRSVSFPLEVDGVALRGVFVVDPPGAVGSGDVAEPAFRRAGDPCGRSARITLARDACSACRPLTSLMWQAYSHDTVVKRGGRHPPTSPDRNVRRLAVGRMVGWRHLHRGFGGCLSPASSMQHRYRSGVPGFVLTSAYYHLSARVRDAS